MIRLFSKGNLFSTSFCLFFLGHIIVYIPIHIESAIFFANSEKPCRHITRRTPHPSRNSSQNQIPIRFPSPSGHAVTQTSLNQDSPQRCLATRSECQQPSNEPSRTGHLFWKKKSQGIIPKRLLWQNGSSDNESVAQELQIPAPETGNHGRGHILQQNQPKRKLKGCIASKGWDRDPSLFLSYSWRSTRVIFLRFFYIGDIFHAYPINIPWIFHEDIMKISPYPLVINSLLVKMAHF